MLKRIYKINIISLASILIIIIVVISVLLNKLYIKSTHIQLSNNYSYQKLTELENMDIDFIYNNEKINFKNPIYIKNSSVFAEIDDLSRFIGFNYFYIHSEDISYLRFEKDNKIGEYAFSQENQEKNGNTLFVIPPKASAYYMDISEKPFVVLDDLVYFPIYDILTFYNYPIENWENNMIVIGNTNEKAILNSYYNLQKVRVITISGIKIKYNEEEVIFKGAKPTYIGDFTYVPAKDVFEAMGYKVVWLNNGSPVRLGVGKDNAGLLVTKGDDLFFLPKDDKNVNINRNIKFDEKFNPEIIDGTYMIDCEYIGYLTGKYVYEKEKGLYLFNTIYISDEKIEEMEPFEY